MRVTGKIYCHWFGDICAAEIWFTLLIHCESARRVMTRHNNILCKMSDNNFLLFALVDRLLIFFQLVKKSIWVALESLFAIINILSVFEKMSTLQRTCEQMSHMIISQLNGFNILAEFISSVTGFTISWQEKDIALKKCTFFLVLVF